MASLIDSATEKFKAAVQARRDSLHQVEEDRGVDRAEAQRIYEERIARETAAREAKRGPTVPREELDRREAEKWATIATLRNLRDEIETRRRDLIAKRNASVETGTLDEAIDCQQRLATFDVIAGIAASRLSAYGVEVK